MALIYIAMDCIMRYVFSLHVFKQMGVHTHAHTKHHLHSFIRLNTHSRKNMFSHDKILINPKSYGLVHDVCVKKMCVCCTVFADALI